ncbi:marine proteobacterial sortase target protein [Alkalimarinus alittae]|uniref:Marine proteobacterial sortase target protein n=1 Tax=Alkalimarinus alittae TaxID=2961619 RepID=A0ABY6N3I7_9ALTE|nr:marine proteobacterial sortase target protein [Alkalimarinus alittae]UZE96577.1 marine proteobacterial sortase target protein [Alkalimarinus alittae]
MGLIVTGDQFGVERSKDDAIQANVVANWRNARLQDMLMVVALLLLLLGYSLSAQAFTARDTGNEVTLDQVESGRLLWKPLVQDLHAGATNTATNVMRYKPATLLEEDVTINVSGLILTATLKQRFKNDSNEWLEAVYVFPLPENAALYQMEMRVGDRLIKGQVKEKSQAKKIYQNAKAEGKKAALVEQHRPNLFTNNIANIPPGETIEVMLEYNQVIRYDQGEFELRFPLTTTPRYFPGVAVSENGQRENVSMDEASAETIAHHINLQNPSTAIDTSTGWALPTTQVADAHQVSPFTIPLASMPVDTHKVTLTAEIDAGFPIDGVSSLSHQVEVLPAKSGYQIALKDGKSPMDRDFVLTWKPQVGAEPKAALFTEEWQGERYSLLMVVPPQQLPEEMVLPREQVFVIDTSGSMGGESIRQAKASLEKALMNLRSSDRFNVIEFNSYTHSLFQHSVPASQSNINEARNYVKNLQADGGTEMASALTAGFSGSIYPGYLRQVIFMTDGSVGNERALFNQIERELGDSRLFTIGIGSAPNSYFMRKAAEFGRGSFTYISNLNEVEVKLKKLFDKLRAPVLSNLAMNLVDDRGGVATTGKTNPAESYPNRISDLYLGEPLIQVIKHTKNGSMINLSANSVGMYQSQTPLWTQSINLQGAKQAKGIATYWGRQKIESLMDSGSLVSDADNQAQAKVRLRDQVIEVALKHHLVSPYTSLVAVEEVISRPEGAGLNKAAVPQLLPKGSTQKMARFPQTATSSQLYMLVGFLTLMLGMGMIFLNSARAPFSKQMMGAQSSAMSQ